MPDNEPKIIIDTSILDDIVSEIPLTPGFVDGKEGTIKEMLPDLTPEEFAYVVKNYTGTMKAE